MNRVVKGLVGGAGLAASAMMAYKTVESYHHVESIRPTHSHQVVHIGQFTISHETEANAKSGLGQVPQFFTDLPRGFGNMLGLNNDKQPTLSPVDAYLGNTAAEFTLFLIAGAAGGYAVRTAVKK